VLEVEREGADPLLLPMVATRIRSVDVATKRIDVSLDFMGEA
jgi:ribosomal 30S subunit maturation factor RimM